MWRKKLMRWFRTDFNGERKVSEYQGSRCTQTMWIVLRNYVPASDKIWCANFIMIVIEKAEWIIALRRWKNKQGRWKIDVHKVTALQIQQLLQHAFARAGTNERRKRWTKQCKNEFVFVLDKGRREKWFDLWGICKMEHVHYFLFTHTEGRFPMAQMERNREGESIPWMVVTLISLFATLHYFPHFVFEYFCSAAVD